MAKAETADRGGEELEAKGRHPHALRGLLVVAQGGQSAADPRALDEPRHRHRDDREQDHDGEQEGDVAAEGRPARAEHAQPPRAADELPVHDHRLEHDGQRQGGDGEEDPAQAQREIADAEPEQCGDQTAGQDEHGQRRAYRLDEEDGGVRPQREEGRGAEVHVAPVAAQDVPRGGDDDVLEDDVAGEVEVRVHAQRGDDNPRRHHGQAH